MLVLSRKAGESIQIGDGITVQVARISGRHVKLLIDAPRDVDVDRSEIRERKRNTEASVHVKPRIPGNAGVRGRERKVPR